MINPFRRFNETAVPSSLNFTQAQVNWILGQSLASIYQDLLKSPTPENLQALLDRLDEEHPSSEDDGSQS
jgi:hypothetical protein